MFLRAHGRKSMPVCLEALLFLCSFVLMSLCFSALAANLIEHHNIPTSSPIQFGLAQKRCKGHTKALHPSKEVCNLYPNICSLPVSLLVNECVCFYCHLTLSVRNNLIYRGFKSVRCVQSILHTPCIHLTHHIPPVPQLVLSYAVDYTPLGRRKISRSNRLFCSPML